MDDLEVDSEQGWANPYLCIYGQEQGNPRVQDEGRRRGSESVSPCSGNLRGRLISIDSV